MPVDPHRPPWRAVALLLIPGVARCTAVLVTPTLAATAAHCLWNHRTQRLVPVGSIHLLFGYDAGAFERHVIPDAIRLAAGAAPDQPGARGSDLAMLHLAVAASDPIPPATPPPEPGTRLQLAGFGQDRAERLTVDPGCSLLAYGRGRDGAPLLLHDCSGTRGTSGGPVLTRTGETWRLAGIEIAAEPAAAGGAAIPAEAVSQLIAAFSP